jgi:hypothetical protein
MQKNTTSVKSTDSISDKKRVETPSEFGPKNSTLRNILQFAAAYQAEKISEDQFVGLILN